MYMTSSEVPSDFLSPESFSERIWRERFRHDVFSLYKYFTSHKCGKIMRTIQSAPFNKRLQNAIDNYSILFSENIRGKKSPLPLTKTYLDKMQDFLSKQNTLFLEDSKELFEIAQRATRARSTIYYYSWHSFLAFLIYTFLRYDETSRGHGMYVDPMKDDEICVNIRPRDKQGFLHRLFDLLTVLGYPIALSNWIPIIKEDQSLDFIKNNFSILNKEKISFEEIDKFNISEFLSKISTECGWRYRPREFPYYQTFYSLNKCVLSYIVMFIASNFERYRPHYWVSILEGDNEFTSSVIIRTREAYDDYTTFAILVDDDVFRRLRLYE